MRTRAASIGVPRWKWATAGAVEGGDIHMLRPGLVVVGSSGDRTTPEGKVRVYETRDAGATWTARGDGLPQDDAYLTILRQAFCRDGSGSSMGLYFGATSGDVFGSGDAGKTWFTAATKLPPVHSVRAA